jgi:hypothetical protein
MDDDQDYRKRVDGLRRAASFATLRPHLVRQSQEVVRHTDQISSDSIRPLGSVKVSSLRRRH